METIRLLKAEEIECRVGIINERGLSLLLFKDARVDQKLLDETFTPMGWKRSHQSIDGNLYCTVSVWDERKNQWVDKQDVGTMAREEKEKSQASDSFKRACFNWGIGRELYTAPFIWLPADRVAISVKDTGNGGKKYSTNERFRVVSIGYTENREIQSLAIENSKCEIVYMYSTTRAMGAAAPGKPQKEEEGKQTKTGLGRRQMDALEREMDRTGVALETVLKRYQIKTTEEMTPEMYRDAISGLKKSRSVKAA